MKTRHRIPRTINGFNNWINMVVSYLLATLPGTASASWIRLGLTANEINQLIAQRDAWNTLFAKYSNKNEVRTKAIKDALLLVLVNTLPLGEKILLRIEGSPAVELDDLETFDLKRHTLLRDKNPTRVPPPTTHPVITFINCSEPGKHTLKFKDELQPGRGKPPGIKFAEVAYIIRPLDSPPDSVDDCTHYVIASRSPHVVNHAATDAGKQAFYFLRWINNNGQTGGWSSMYHAPIV